MTRSCVSDRVGTLDISLPVSTRTADISQIRMYRRSIILSIRDEPGIGTFWVGAGG